MVLVDTLDDPIKDNYVLESTTVSETKSLQVFKNGMLCYSFGWALIFLSFQHFIVPALELMPCFVAYFDQHLWHSMDKGAELDLRFTKIFLISC